MEQSNTLSKLIEELKNLEEEISLKNERKYNLIEKIESLSPFKIGNKVVVECENRNWKGEVLTSKEIVFISGIRFISWEKIPRFEYKFRKMKKDGTMAAISAGICQTPKKIELYDSNSN